MREFTSPSPPPPPPPPVKRTTTEAVSALVTKSQVFEFSYSNRAGTVSLATEPAAQVTRPTTPFPGQSSQAAGVSGFTPSRPDDVVVNDMLAGPSTSGVLGGGRARRLGGDKPVKSPSPAMGWGKAITGRGRHSDSHFVLASPAAPVPPSVSQNDLTASLSEGSQPAPGSRADQSRLSLYTVPSDRLGEAPIPLGSEGSTVDSPPGSQSRSGFYSIGSVGQSSIAPLSGLGTLPFQAAGNVGGSVPSASASNSYPSSVSGPAQMRPTWATSASGLVPPMSSAMDPWSFWGWRFPGMGSPWSWCPSGPWGPPAPAPPPPLP